MPTATIKLSTPAGLGAITAIDCGSSTPKLGGTLDVSAFPNLTSITCNSNGITKFQGYDNLTNLVTISLQDNSLTGNIPNLSNLTALTLSDFFANQLTGWDGGTVSTTLGSFQAHNNSLTTSTIDALLAAFVAANRTTGTRLLNLGGTNAAPSSTGVTTTTTTGANFSRLGTTVTVNLTNHGYITGDWVTITSITEAAFQGTFSITRINNNQFTYTTVTSSNITAGTGAAILRKTSTGNTSGFRSYQNLALVSRTGGPWTVSIRFPA
jgi:hypothetical protein